MAVNTGRMEMRWKTLDFDAGKETLIEIVGIVQDVKHDLNVPVTDYYLPPQDAWADGSGQTTVDPPALPLFDQVCH